MCVISTASKVKVMLPHLLCHTAGKSSLLICKRVRDTEESLKGYGRDVYRINVLNCLSPLTLSCLLPFFLFQVTEKLLDVENETMMKVADLEKQLLHKDKELSGIKVGHDHSLSITYITFTHELNMQIAHIIIYLYIKV